MPLIYELNPPGSGTVETFPSAPAVVLPITMAPGAVRNASAWTTSGRTLGGRLVGQRVVSIDGSRLSLLQSALRLAALPLSALRRYPAHDDIAATTVVEDSPV